MNLITKGIKKLGNYGIILLGFSLFIGCSSPLESEELSTIIFELDARMEEDVNGYTVLML